MRSTLNSFRIRSIAALIGMVIVVAACTSPAGAGAPDGAASAAPAAAGSAAPAAPAGGAGGGNGY